MKNLLFPSLLLINTRYSIKGLSVVVMFFVLFSVSENVNALPTFSSTGDTATRAIAENAPRDTTIGSAFPLNTDGYDLRTIRARVRGEDGASFSAHVSTKHQWIELKTKAALDYETKNLYTVELKIYAPAREAALPVVWLEADTVTVTINITDIDLSFREGDTATRAVQENAPLGTNIGSAVTVANFDASRDDYILSGTDASSFTIDSTTGQLQTKVGLNYESKSAYSVEVIARAREVKEGSISVTINVTNVDLQFTDGDSTTRSVQENTASNRNIGSPVSASNFNRNLDRYTLSGTDANSFRIDSSTGQLKTKAALDYEVKTSYSVTVNVHAGAHVNTEDSIRVTIHVTNGPDTSCPPGWILRDNECYKIVYGAGFGEADALPPLSSEEAARLISLIQMDRIVFNEIFNASNDAQDWVELRNISDTDINLDGWQLIVSTRQGNQSVKIPIGTVLPVGELLLLRNTEQSYSDASLKTVPEDVSSLSLVDARFVLPHADFMLLLRSPTAWEDNAGNYFFGYETLETAPPLTVDTAWSRAKPNTPGSRSEAWSQDGLGTPGHRRELLGDANGDDVVNILDLVLVAAQFGASGETTADLNNDGTINIQDLVVVANAIGGGAAAAPSARALTAGHVQEWLRLANGQTTLPIQTSVSQPDFSYQRGIQVLEQLLQMLTPKETALLANYPNPFNPETWIPYQLATDSDVQITIYDMRGTLMCQLNLGHQPVGSYQTQSRAAYWDGKNSLGESVASGIYFYTLTAGDFSATRRMLILK